MTDNDQKFIELCKENKEVILALLMDNYYNENLLQTTKGTYIKLNFDKDGIMRNLVRGETQLWSRK